MVARDRQSHVVQSLMSNAFGSPVDGIGVSGAKFSTIGSVDPASTVPLDDFELGILQAVVASRMVSVYADAGRKPGVDIYHQRKHTPHS